MRVHPASEKTHTCFYDSGKQHNFLLLFWVTWLWDPETVNVFIENQQKTPCPAPLCSKPHWAKTRKMAEKKIKRVLVSLQEVPTGFDSGQCLWKLLPVFLSRYVCDCRPQRAYGLSSPQFESVWVFVSSVFSSRFRLFSFPLRQTCKFSKIIILSQMF